MIVFKYKISSIVEIYEPLAKSQISCHRTSMGELGYRGRGSSDISDHCHFWNNIGEAAGCFWHMSQKGLELTKYTVNNSQSKGSQHPALPERL